MTTEQLLPTSGQLAWEPPGPGAWSLEVGHFTRPMPPITADVFINHFPRGLREGFAECGLLLDVLSYAGVNGFAYLQPRVVGAPAGSATPPKAVFQVLTRLHPAIRARGRVAARMWERKPWLAAASEWAQTAKPAMIAAARALQREQVDRLEDADLMDHLDRAVAHLRRASWTHGRYTAPALVPLGALLAMAQDWEGLEAPTVLAAVMGVDRRACGRSDLLPPAAEAVRADPPALALLERPSDPGGVLRDLGATPAGPSVQAWLEEVGLRLSNGYDLGAPTLLEVPRLLVAQLRAAVHGEEGRATGDRLAALRARVPAAQRAEFEALLTDIAAVHRLRDERVLYCDLWAHGIVRRAVLEAGARLEHRGRVEAADHLIEASLDEIRALFDSAWPTAAELAARARRRAALTVDDAPRFLGGTPPTPPPAEWLPAPLRSAHRVTLAVLGALFDDSDREHEEHRIAGIGVSPGTAEGVARVLSTSEDMGRIEPGDILVTRTTSPAFNAVLPLIGAVVTDRGGALSHAAIVAREYGIPGVVGTRDATARILDGARVRVDGTAGDVVVLP